MEGETKCCVWSTKENGGGDPIISFDGAWFKLSSSPTDEMNSSSGEDERLSLNLNDDLESENVNTTSKRCNGSCYNTGSRSSYSSI